MTPHNSEPVLRFLRLVCRGESYWDRLRGADKSHNMTAWISFYRRLWENAARSIEADFEELARDFWRVRLDSASTLINNYVVQIDDPVVLRIAGNKPLCHSLLRNKGLPVPDHETYTIGEFHKARRFISQNAGGIFVVKPAVGTSGGRGVTLHVRSIAECRRATARASLYGEQLMIERFIPGECYRLLFLGGEMIHAVRQRGVWVTGDGQSTIQNLLRRQYCLNGSPVAETICDPDYRTTIGAQGLTDSSVPESGKRVLVKSSFGGDPQTPQALTRYDENVTTLVGEGVISEACRGVAALGSRFASVELVTMDPTVSLRASGGAIIEINTTPGLHRHYSGGPEDDAMLPVTVLSFLLKAASGPSHRPKPLEAGEERKESRL
jgi:hypothetical protein